MDVPASDPAIPMAATSAVVPVPPPHASRPTTLVLGFVLALVVGIGGTLLFVRPVRETTPLPPRVEAPVAPEKPTTATIHVETEPTGATVTLDGVVKGQTPLDLLRAADASGNVSAQLVLTRPGYLPLAVTAGGSGRIEIRQKLQPVPPAPVVVKEEKKVEPRPAVGETRPPEITVAPPEKPEKVEKTTSSKKHPPTPAPVVHEKKHPASKIDEEFDAPLDEDLKRPPSLKK
jgi:hypothetical protein